MSIPAEARPGDFFVVRTHGTAADVICVATRSKYNHAGIYMPDPTYDYGTVGVPPTRCVEAAPSGARLTSADYGDDKILVSNFALTPSQRYALCEVARGLIGTPYGWEDIVSIGALQYGIKPDFIRDRVENSSYLICSQLVDEVYRRVGLHLFADGRLPMDVTPGDLGRRIALGGVL